MSPLPIVLSRLSLLRLPCSLLLVNHRPTICPPLRLTNHLTYSPKSRSLSPRCLPLTKLTRSLTPSPTNSQCSRKTTLRLCLVLLTNIELGYSARIRQGSLLELSPSLINPSFSSPLFQCTAFQHLAKTLLINLFHLHLHMLFSKLLSLLPKNPCLIFLTKTLLVKCLRLFRFKPLAPLLKNPFLVTQQQRSFSNLSRPSWMTSQRSHALLLSKVHKHAPERESVARPEQDTGDQ